MGKSINREGIFGPYTEHYDDDGNKIGESKPREGIFEDYVENFDNDGNKIGESKDRDGVFEEYTEHCDSSGEKIGESKAREGVFEDHTEHFDIDGQKIGESKYRQGIFDNYTEHEGAYHIGENRRNTKHSSSSAHNAEGDITVPTSSAFEEPRLGVLFILLLAIVAILTSLPWGQSIPDFEPVTTQTQSDTFSSLIAAGQVNGGSADHHVSTLDETASAFRRCIGDMSKPACYVLVTDAQKIASPIMDVSAETFPNQIPLGFSGQKLIIEASGKLFSFDLDTDKLTTLASRASLASLAPDKSSIAFVTAEQPSATLLHLFDLNSTLQKTIYRFEAYEPGKQAIRWLRDNNTMVVEMMVSNDSALETWQIKRDGSRLTKIADGQIYELSKIDFGDEIGFPEELKVNDYTERPVTYNESRAETEFEQLLDATTQYEYECNLERVTIDRVEWTKYAAKYPLGLHTEKVLTKIISLNFYPTQCGITRPEVLFHAAAAQQAFDMLKLHFPNSEKIEEQEFFLEFLAKKVAGANSVK